MQAATVNPDRPNPSREKGVMSGRTVLGWLIGFFAVIFLANAAFLYFAISSFSGIEETSAYKAGQTFARNRQEAQAQNERAWNVSADIVRSGAGADIKVHARDANGAPVRDVSFIASFKRPAEDRDDHEIELVQGEAGVYAAQLPGIAAGQWLVLISADGVDAQTGSAVRLFRSESRIVLKD